MAGLSQSSSADTTTTTTTTNGIPNPPVDPVASAHEVEDDNEYQVLPEEHLAFDEALLPGGVRDLSYIGVQAFGLGNAFTGTIVLTAYLVSIGSTWWRLPAFLVCLSIFHFLEYWTTARYNAPSCKASSFLLFSNGAAYNIAHSCATLEIVVSQFFPVYQKTGVYAITILAGVVLVLVGQVVRTIAMCQAGTNFNHIVQGKKKDDHELVTDGIYSYFRHPSYFGFFWWAVGTQVLVGNKVCLVGYVIVLWQFFNDRIRGEEKYLISFFGEKYEDFKKRTGTKIPFIR
ncbi:Isoprenylcysteine O-methyltransferase [Fulvia fulva]|uniref:Protein-S-isoprenylcysteine O-methyltransferase n=1 Tax=Passalora fulva TaxID=5499 RepID=A0A9Q8LIM5_PASFU|nr:Isoprenylcysteine O-methyltransferase [Fulvia fulva]KAK4623669.1 Isoprenylcysteine O-methyltransferase [Fulvia fulva]KAK4625685.1 Isoprenylcysteine O-methyltransferase [Fulvia fulva]UJO18185.1 Isoprenylcysteine O-methyltransferase [Fulvia fulva]WPV15579.1 Isoprenylcysteine O-methyltransferase [Fulvia fulva]WPV29882.1 Isoprenylcysteine O-methyltransferase [Fulvia fulva]